MTTRSAWLCLALAMTHASAHAETCLASFYDRGARTANGEHFNPNGMTAAHLAYPFGSILRVTDAVSGRAVMVLARGAARQIDMESRGVIRIHIKRLR